MAGLPYRAIAVSGASMSPTYNEGDWLIFRSISKLNAKKLQRIVGKVVVIERENYPGILFIKRIVHLENVGIWVEGDNKEASTDSRNWGVLSSSEIRGRVIIRYKRVKL